MRPEFLSDRASAPFAAASTASEIVDAPKAVSGAKTLPAAAAGVTARDLYDLLAVIIGVCESLAENLKGSPQHAELARVGVLAADRAADLVGGLRIAAGPPSADLAQTGARGDETAELAADFRAARKVLLVEDDPDLLLLLTAAFMKEGFETYCAKNGRVGVDMLKSLKPDLMVTDIVMPEMEGIGAILEARRSSPATKVIAISGGGHYGRSQNFLAWAHELGADEVLAKPFRMSSLILAARVVLDRPPATSLSDEFDPDAEDAGVQDPGVHEPRRLAANR